MNEYLTDAEIRRLKRDINIQLFYEELIKLNIKKLVIYKKIAKKCFCSERTVYNTIRDYINVTQKA